MITRSMPTPEASSNMIKTAIDPYRGPVSENDSERGSCSLIGSANGVTIYLEMTWKNRPD